MDRHKFRNRLIIYVIFFSFFTSLFGFWSLNFLGPDEPRYAEIGFNMAKSGDYVLPLLRGTPWLEKPPLLYWFVAIGSKIFGQNEIGARFFIVLFSFLYPIFLFLLFNRYLKNLRLSYYTTLILIFSPFWFVFSKSISCDLLFSAFLFISILSLYFCFATKRDVIFLLFLSSLSLSLSILSKGVLALILFFIFFYIFSLQKKKFYIFDGKFFIVNFFSILLSFPWFYLAYKKVGEAFLWVFFVNHNLARFFTPIHYHVKPFYYFIPVFFLIFFPYSILIFRLHKVLKWSKRNIEPSVFIYTFLVYFLFFSISSSKLPAYILPGIFLLIFPVGVLMEKLEHKSWNRWFIYIFLIIDISLIFFLKFYSFYKVLIFILIMMFFTFFSFLYFRKVLKGIIFKLFSMIFIFFILAVPFMNQNFSSKKMVSSIPKNYIKKCDIFLYKTYEMTCGIYTNYRCNQNVLSKDFLKEKVEKCGEIYLLLKTDKLYELINSFTEYKMYIRVFGRYSKVRIWK